MKAEELEKLAALRDKGILTDLEFEQEKEKILARDAVVTRTRFNDGDDEIEAASERRGAASGKKSAGGKKNIFDRYVDCIKKYAVFNGRASRAEYWSFVLVNSLTSFAIGFVDGLANFGNVMSAAYSLFVFLPSISAAVRRFHDTEHSGWWVIIPFVPLLMAAFGAGANFFRKEAFLLGVVLSVVLLGYSFYLSVKKGDAETNKYGSPSV